VTLGEALRAAVQSLEAERIGSARLTAEVLLAHCLEVERPHLYTHDTATLNETAGARYQAMILERASGVPLQYITGTQEFYGRPFRVDPSVLIPRPETELIVETTLELNDRPTPRIIDVGTGSGCIGTTLALELPGARVTATDLSEAAVRTATMNAATLGAPVSFAIMDGLAAAGDPCDIIVSNPPYVGPDELSGLQTEVRAHEPAIALVGTGEPDDLYRRLIQDAGRILPDDGLLLMEIGYSMESRVRSMFSGRWTLLPTRFDLQGFPRVVVARRGLRP